MWLRKLAILLVVLIGLSGCAKKVNYDDLVKGEDKIYYHKKNETKPFSGKAKSYHENRKLYIKTSLKKGLLHALALSLIFIRA